MLDSNDLLNAMKKVSASVIKEMQPSSFVIGKVISEKPLKIQLDQKIILSKEQIILARNVTDFEIDVEMTWKTEDKAHNHIYKDGVTENNTHKHVVKGKKKLKIFNGLRSGEIVAMIMQHGGQQFLVVDRVVDT